MTGFERNADVVEMSAYAPLLAHVDAWQWTPNLIWFDNLRSFGTPSYYAQQMFGANLGARVLPMTLNGNAANGDQRRLLERGDGRRRARGDPQTGQPRWRFTADRDLARPGAQRTARRRQPR